MTCIDVLSKHAVVVPLGSREAPDAVAGTMEALQKMGKKSKIICTDDEGSRGGRLFKEYVEGEGIELHRTRGRPAFMDRFTRTFKDKPFKRVEAGDLRNSAHLQS